MTLATVEFWTASFCPYQRLYWTQFLVLLYYAHYAISAAIFFEGLVRTKELYLLFLSFGIALNAFLNYFLLWTFSVPVPFAACGSMAFWCIDRQSPFNACGTAPFPVPNHPGVDCGSPPLPACDPCVPCGMPAIEPQLSAFTVASVGIFVFQWRAPHIKFYQVFLLLTFYTLILFSHVYFNYNTPAQVVAGTAVGATLALLYQLFVYVVAYPNFNRIVEWPLVRRFGYKNTFCQPPPTDDARTSAVAVNGAF